MKERTLLRRTTSLIVFFLGLALAPAALASTTTLTFDDVATGALTTQYQSLGVTASGVDVVDAALSVWPAFSAPNIAVAPTGLMTFTFNQTITGNITTVSAYLSGTTVGIYAYDIYNNLVGQASLPAGAPSNTLVSVSTSGSPIATVTIHDGGSTFAIDNFTFTTAPTCPQVAQTLYNATSALPSTDFQVPKLASYTPSLLLNEISYFQKLVANNASESQLLNSLYTIRQTLNKTLKTGPNQTYLLSLVNQLIQMTQGGQC